jgi:hypothetical protein
VKKHISTFKKCTHCDGDLYLTPPKEKPYLRENFTIPVYPSFSYWLDVAHKEKWPVIVFNSFICKQCNKQTILEEKDCFELEEIET